MTRRVLKYLCPDKVGVDFLVPHPMLSGNLFCASCQTLVVDVSSDPRGLCCILAMYQIYTRQPTACRFGNPWSAKKGVVLIRGCFQNLHLVVFVVARNTGT